MEPAGSPGLRPSLPEWAIVSPARREHIERVAALAGRWAMEMGVPDSERHRWLRAVWLHDALRDAPEEELLRWAPSTPGPPELRHGPASAARAKSQGRDRPRRAGRRALSLDRSRRVGHGRADSLLRRLPGARPRARARVARRPRPAPPHPAGARAPRRGAGAGRPHDQLPPLTAGTYGPLLEQSRRRAVRLALILLVAAGLATAVRLLVPPPPPAPRAHAYPIPSPEHRVTVEVLNGTRRSGEARAATRMLRRRGLDVVFFGNADADRGLHPGDRAPRRSRPGSRGATGARRGADRGRDRHAPPGGRERDPGGGFSGAGRRAVRAGSAPRVPPRSRRPSRSSR